jgi:hypothetical protein
MTIGFDKPLYVLPFDHRGTFQKNMFGWTGAITPAQTAEIAAAKAVIYDGFKAAIAAGVAKEKAGILVDEQFGRHPPGRRRAGLLDVVPGREERAGRVRLRVRKRFRQAHRGHWPDLLQGSRAVQPGGGRGP